MELPCGEAVALDVADDPDGWLIVRMEEAGIEPGPKKRKSVNRKKSDS